MTCIVGFVEERTGVIHMAGDRMASDGFTKFLVDRPKVFKKENFIMGYTTSFKMGHLLEFEWCPPPREVGELHDDYIYRKVVKSFEALFKSLDYGEKHNSYYQTGEFLFGYEGKLYKHHPQGFITSGDILACGSGEYHAVAALEVLLRHNLIINIDSVFTEVMSVTSKYITSVSPQFDYIYLTQENVC